MINDEKASFAGLQYPVRPMADQVGSRVVSRSLGLFDVCSTLTRHSLCRRIIESIFFRLFTLLLLFVDFIIVIVDLALGHDSHYGLKVAEFVLCVYFMLEVITRLLVITPKAFFVHWYNILDVAVVFDAFVVSSVALFNKGAIEYFALFSLLRSFRIIHRIALIYMEKENLQTAARQLISENKRR